MESKSLRILAETPLTVDTPEFCQILQELSLTIDRLLDNDVTIHSSVVKRLHEIVCLCPNTMASTILHKVYSCLKERCDAIAVDKKSKSLLYSIISFSATVHDKNFRDTLHFCLKAENMDISIWGYKYVRRVEIEIVEEWFSNEENRCGLYSLIKRVVEFYLKSGVEMQACAFLLQINRLDFLEINRQNYLKLCNCLISSSLNAKEHQKMIIYYLVMKQFFDFKEYSRALCIALSVNDKMTICKIFQECQDLVVRKQIACVLGRFYISWDITDKFHDKSNLTHIMSNYNMNENFRSLATKLNIMEPKTPYDVLEIQLENTELEFSWNLRSELRNLALTYVNAFVNTGFSCEKLLCAGNDYEWIYKNNNNGILSATASLGLIYLWDVHDGLALIKRKYLVASNDYIKAGALLAAGILNFGVRDECDLVMPLLSDFTQNESSVVQGGAILGLGLAFAGTKRKDVLSLLTPVIDMYNSHTSEIVALAALSCGLINVGCVETNLHQLICRYLINIPASELPDDHHSKFIPLSIGLFCLGMKDKAEIFNSYFNILPASFKPVASLSFKMCTYAGTGDLAVIQELYRKCTENSSPPSNGGNSFQGISALAIAVVAMGSKDGTIQTTKLLKQLEIVGTLPARRAIPLAFGLLYVSNPQWNILDGLFECVYNYDEELSYNAIFAIGLIGAGTSSTKMCLLLQMAAQHFSQNAHNVFMMRIAVGLINLGKGTLSLSPFQFDSRMMNSVAVSGLIITLFSFLDIRNRSSPYFLFTLVTAIYPRWVVTFDEDFEPISVPVRIGPELSNIETNNRPTITEDYVISETPVLLPVGEKAALATDEYTCLSPFLEGFVILRKNMKMTEN